MKERRCISKLLKPEVMARAYELLCCTDMDMVEVSRALKVQYGALNSAIRKAENSGLYIYVKPGRGYEEKTLKYLCTKSDPVDAKEISDHYNGSYREFRQALLRLYKKKVVQKKTIGEHWNKQPIYGFYLE